MPIPVLTNLEGNASALEWTKAIMDVLYDDPDLVGDYTTLRMFLLTAFSSAIEAGYDKAVAEYEDGKS